MPGSILGTRVARVEDPDLLRGHGTYVGNRRPDGLLHLQFVRSPMAHARLIGVDVSEAERFPGVVAVFTASSLSLPAFEGAIPVNEHCARPPLATDKVRFVGEPVAAVVAETREAAVDAAEAVVVDYDPLPAVTDPEAAMAPGAPLQFEDLGTNLAFGSRDPQGASVLADADRVVRLRLVNQRIAVVPMEGNAITVVPGDDGDGHDLTIHVSTQMPHGFWARSADTLGLDKERVRVVSPHVGGGFGAKTGLNWEHAVVIAAARQLGRAVTWVETRSENMVAMPHGRGQIDYIELGLRDDGVITGLRCRIVGDAGAYAGFGGMLPAFTTRMMAQGVYRIPKISYDVAAVLTNTTPMGAFRGAGRPEAAEFLERVMDLAADELGIDPIELRRRNLLGGDIFPYTTQMGTTYDSGDYALALDEALRLAGYDELRTEQADRLARGDRLVLGIGVGVYVEITAMGGQEYSRVEVHPDGTASIRVGTSAHGQGHATAFSMIVADRLGIPLESIRFIQSDTALVPRGGGTGGSRSLQLGGSSVLSATEQVLERARQLAADRLEADVGDIVLTDDGRLGVAGVPSASLSWSELSTEAAAQGDPLAAELDFVQENATFPFGAHVAVVEVDLDTGAVRPLRHVAVDDCGRILNPLLVTGQQHGGIAQGVAQALWEEVRFDEEGNPVSANLADYAMPSAAELIFFETANTETPTPLNPLGAKGIGESGTIGSTPAVHNAVVDALSHLGVRHVDMPCTPQRVWQAVRDAEAGRPAAAWRDAPAFLADLPAPEPLGDTPAVDL
jgi:carbon-monoxide dehydrogenase large subunit